MKGKRIILRVLPPGVCLVCLLVLGLLIRGDRAMTAELTAQNAANRWQTPSSPCAMASVFLPAGQALPETRLGEIYLNVDKALKDAGVGDRNWYLAASRQTEGVLRNGDAAARTELFAVTGDFFLAHPMPLRYGVYPDEKDVMHDRIVLDRAAAWALFYGDNVAGQYVELNGAALLVAAVVDMEPGRDSALARGDGCHAWVLSDCPALSDRGSGFTCLEAVLPQPVRDFTAGTLTKALGDLLPEGMAVTDNSGRFSLKNRWNALRNLAVRSLGTADLPYWERAARLTETRLAIRLIPEGLLLAVAVLELLAQLLWWNSRRTWGLHSLKEKAEEAVDWKRRRDWDRRMDTAKKGERHEEELETPAGAAAGGSPLSGTDRLRR